MGSVGADDSWKEVGVESGVRLMRTRAKLSPCLNNEGFWVVSSGFLGESLMHIVSRY